MSTMPKVFDRQASRLRRARAARMLSSGAGKTPDFLLARVAEDFSERLSAIKRTFVDVLDLGAQHGVVGRRLIANHGYAHVTSADEDAALLAMADGSRVQVDLERLPFAAASFDLVVSGLVLQSVDDLPGVLAQVRRMLRPDGLMLAALIGGRSLTELREALLAAETEVTGGASPRVAPMVDVRDLGTLLQRAQFALPVVDSDVVTVTYAHPLQLLHELRAMGATNGLSDRQRNFLRRAVLVRGLEIYRERFTDADGRVRATFEILTATAWAPHESQQKPLAPGSAQTRLADALKPRGEE